MAKAMGWCVPCHEAGTTVQAVAVVDGDGLCGICLRTAGGVPASPLPPPVVKPLSADLCGRGCGKAPHRGACAGVPKLVPAAPAPLVASEFKAVAAKIDGFLGKTVEVEPVVAQAETAKVDQDAGPLQEKPRKRETMDKLVSKRVRVEDIPAAATQRSPIGRIGELWLKVMSLPLNQAECVENLNVPRAGYTVRHMFKKALKAQVDLRARRVGLQVYFWVGDGKGRMPWHKEGEAARG